MSIPALENSIHATAASAQCSAGGRARKILVVDDNVDAADSLSMLLQLSGYDLTVAHDGAEALRVLVQEVPDVILLDIGLPGMNGYEVAQRVRELPALAQTRLIAMTGYGQESDKKAAAAAGFDAHLVKPVDYQLLTRMIEGAVS
jgi:CheY-like chemotaxis protein